MAVTVLALDPGVTTGWALWKSSYNQDRVDRGQFTGNHVDFVNMLDDFHPSNAPFLIVYERFLYQRRDKVNLYPVEVIGIIKYYCTLYDVPVWEQSPSQAKNLWSDDKLKRMNLWIPGQGHAMDATRHLLYHLVVTRGDKSWLESLRPT